MDDVRPFVYECHLKVWRAQHAKARARANCNDQKMSSTAKHELPLKHCVPIVSTTTRVRFIHWHLMVLSISGVNDGPSDHRTLQNRFKIYLIIVLSHRSKFSSISFILRYFPVYISRCRRRKKRSWLLTAYYYSPVHSRDRTIYRAKAHRKYIDQHQRTAIDALWQKIALAKNCRSIALAADFFLLLLLFP